MSLFNDLGTCPSLLGRLSGDCLKNEITCNDLHNNHLNITFLLLSELIIKEYNQTYETKFWKSKKCTLYTWKTCSLFLNRAVKLYTLYIENMLIVSLQSCLNFYIPTLISLNLWRRQDIFFRQNIDFNFAAIFQSLMHIQVQFWVRWVFEKRYR